MTQRLRVSALLLALCLAAGACGQKEGVHEVGFAGGGAAAPATVDSDGDGVLDAPAFDDGAFVGAATDAELADDGAFDVGDGSAFTSEETAADGAGAAPTAGTPAGSTPTAPSGGTAGSGAGATTGGGPQPSAPAAASAGPNDRVGVTDTELRIGVHAPLSGAAPLPQASFDVGKDQYWKHVGQVDGRTVRVVLRDDQFNPSRATSVCNQMIQQDQVLLLVGGGGADQVAACARTAAQQGVPYLSAGVDEGVLRQLPNYFALSMSYVQQASLLADFIVARHKPSDGLVGLLRDRTPSYNNLIGALERELGARGLRTQVVQYQNGPSSAQAMSRFETAFVIMAPSGFLQVVRSPGGTNPQWVGVGITMGLNTVVGAACEGGNRYKGQFFSPFPGLNVIDELDPEFRRAGGADDIQLALWGLNKTIHETLKVVGRDVGRAAFTRALETNEIASGVYPTLRHTPENHFGANAVHLLVADCATGRNATPPGGTFVTRF